MIGNSEIKKILYGGDYNPEQWPEEIWEEDMRMLKLAHIDILTLNVFNWAMLQPDENTYDFSRMDKIMNMVRDNGFKVFMATSTGAHPAWMARKHPDILRTQANGVRRKYGRRHNACPNSPTYRKYAAALTERIAQRYAGYENIVAWHAICKLKRPDVMRLWSYQAVAHGADTIMFFQMRRSLGACEKFHGAVIDHVGHENTRVFREIEALGSELKDRIKDLTVGSRMESRIAILFDWDNWWASEFSAGPSRAINYPQEVKQYYKALYNLHHSVDMVSVEDDLSGYRLVIAPLLYMCKDGFDGKIREYVKNGGAFLTTYFSGYVDEHDLVVPGGYPGKLRDILGIWVEEIDALPEEESNSFDYKGKKYPAYLACDIMHLEGAQKICRYDADFYHGMPVVTKNQYGRGLAYYVGTRTDEAFYREFLGDICEELSIEPVIHAPEGIEAAMRKNEKGEYLFLLNHTKETLSVRMEKAGTDILTDEQYGEGDLLTIKEAGAVVVRIGKEKES